MSNEQREAQERDPRAEEERAIWNAEIIRLANDLTEGRRNSFVATVRRAVRRSMEGDAQ